MDLRWICDGFVVDLRRICGGFATDSRWICDGVVMDLRRICDGFAMDLRWICDGFAMDLWWMCDGFATDVRTLPKCRPTFGGFVVILGSFSLLFEVILVPLGVILGPWWPWGSHRGPRLPKVRFR